MLRHSLVILLAATALLLPPAWNVYESVWLNDWRASPLFDGQAYVVSDGGVVRSEVDETGLAAALATLLTWNGNTTSEAQVLEKLPGTGADVSLADVTALAAEYGIEGQWLRIETGALSQLKTPFVAHMAEGNGRVIIVRDVRSGYAYAADPARGNVLYPLERFVETFTGQVFAFPDPPAQPEEWR